MKTGPHTNLKAVPVQPPRSRMRERRNRAVNYDAYAEGRMTLASLVALVFYVLLWSWNATLTALVLQEWAIWAATQPDPVLARVGLFFLDQWACYSFQLVMTALEGCGWWALRTRPGGIAVLLVAALAMGFDVYTSFLGLGIYGWSIYVVGSGSVVLALIPEWGIVRSVATMGLIRMRSAYA